MNTSLETSNLVVHDISNCIRPGSLNDVLDEILKRDSQQIILVCGSDGDCIPGMLQLCAESSLKSASGSKSIGSILHLLFRQHVDLIRELKSPQLRAHRFNDLTDSLDRLGEFIEAVLVVHELSSFSRDQIVAATARSSCQSVLAALKDRNVAVDYYSEIDTSFPVRTDHPNEEGELQRISAFMSSCIVKSQSRVILFSGYFNLSSGHFFDHFGVLYSNICTSLITSPRKTSSTTINFWIPSHAIFTGPRHYIPLAQPVQILTTDEASELLSTIPGVLHPLAISIAKTNNSLIRLRNICDISSPGTIILPCSRRVTKLGVEVEARATAITMRRDISLLTICSNQRLPSHVFLTKLFTVLERCKLRFLLMSTSGANVTLALPPSHSYVDKLPLPATPRSSSIVASTAAEIAKLNIGTLVQDTGYAVLSVVGEGVCTHAAMVGRCCEALAREGVNVEMISSSAPRLSVCVAMKEEMAVRAVMAVHYELFGGGGRVGNKDRAE